MSNTLRNRLHIAVDKLPSDRLADVLQFVEMLVDTTEDTEIEMEDAWMLSSGAFRVFVPENGGLPIVKEA